MSNERDPAYRDRDMDAETIASRKGITIEEAKDAVDRTGGPDTEAADTETRTADRREH